MQPDLDIAVIATDTAGIVTGWNLAAQRLYGWRAAEALGRSIMDLTPSGQSRDDAAQIMEALRRGETWEGEIVLRRKGGQPFRAYVRDFPVGDLANGAGSIVGVSVPAEDRRLLDDNRAAVEAEVAAWAAAAHV